MTIFDVLIFSAIQLVAIFLSFSFRKSKPLINTLTSGNLALFTATLIYNGKFSFAQVLYLDQDLSKVGILMLVLSVMMIIFGWVQGVLSSRVMALLPFIPVNSLLLLSSLRLDAMATHWIVTIILLSGVVSLSRDHKVGAREAIQLFMKQSFVLLFFLLGISLFIYATSSISLLDVQVMDYRMLKFSALLIIFSWLSWSLVFPFNSWFIDISSSRPPLILAFILLTVCLPYTSKIISLGVKMYQILGSGGNLIGESIWGLCFVSTVYSFLVASNIRKIKPFLAFIVSGLLSLVTFSITINPLFYTTSNTHTFLVLSLVPVISLFILLRPNTNDDFGEVAKYLRSKDDGYNFSFVSFIYFIIVIFGLPVGSLFFYRIEVLKGLFESSGYWPVAGHLMGLLFVIYPIFCFINHLAVVNRTVRSPVFFKNNNALVYVSRNILIIIMLLLSIIPNVVMMSL